MKDSQYYSRFTIAELKQMQERNFEIATWKERGLSYQEIANKFGLSKGHIKTICHKLGVYGPVRKFDVAESLE